MYEAWGQLGPGFDSPPVLRDSIFGVASVSKPVTATAVMMLVEAGKIGIHQPVQKYIPEFEGPGCEKITVRHLLTHTSGLPNRSEAELLDAGKNGLERNPGKQMKSDSGTHRAYGLREVMDMPEEAVPLFG
jgi:CubicO group peptidase (beta-lactamase class C family)